MDLPDADRFLGFVTFGILGISSVGLIRLQHKRSSWWLVVVQGIGYRLLVLLKEEEERN